MQSQATSAFSSLLILVSLAAVPVMAVFGIPQMSRTGGTKESEETAIREFSDDDEMPVRKKSLNSKRLMKRSKGEDEGIERESFPAEDQETERDEFLGGRKAKGDGEARGLAAGMKRLKALGADRCSIEMGETEDQILMVCVMTEPDEPNVVRRFEAEASNALAAIDDLTDQLEQWRASGRR